MQNDSRNFNFAIIIPAFNEEKYLGLCLDSLLKQTLQPSQIVVVDDASTDFTFQIAEKYAQLFSVVTVASTHAQSKHLPGAKVINAFKKGMKIIDLDQYDVICKFDADLIFPQDYLYKLNKAFLNDSQLALCGGVCCIENDGDWQTEILTNLDHIRGALKAYRIEAYKDIGGLQSQMGWDTADEFQLRFKEWELKVIPNLYVKHLKPTAVAYQDAYFKKQGQVFYALRYGFLLTVIASIKISNRNNQLSMIKVVLKSYKNSNDKKLDYLLTRDEGKFLRCYRWKQILRKLIS